MNGVGQLERKTQKRALDFLKNELGYDYLGDWQDRTGNSNVEEELLRQWLQGQGHGDKIITRVLDRLTRAAVISGATTLYDANREVYGLLRYGVKVRPDVGENHITVWLIDWNNIHNNHFAVAEEVTIAGENTKRPDIVLYVNGIALGVIELKRSTVSVAEGIRQNLDNQKRAFIEPFFTTIQLIMAGNETEGLRYGVIETKEKYFLSWKEESQIDNPLHRGLHQLCRKERFLEIIHDFMVFDAGIKKTCRHNQYFGVLATRESIAKRQGGIIWHTQGSGKSLTMVWLAKWIREHIQDGRVLLITDRTELDAQIEKVFKGVREEIHRCRSGRELVQVLNSSEHWLVCSLIHKFGRSDEEDIDKFIQDVRAKLPPGFRAKGDIIVFIDECHRTQSGKLHQAMKTLLPEGLLIGFTGTPLLKKDKRKSVEVFGPYIHTYKYDEAVQDGVVLDLRYEARDIDQNLTSEKKIDQWFELKTKGLTDHARAMLKQRWGTLKKVFSSQDRLDKIASDILFDMETRDRLKSGHGNGILVCSSIYQACKMYEKFQETDLAGHCAIVTSYKPSPADIKGEESGEGKTEKIRQYEIYRRMLAHHFREPEDTAMYRVDEFEAEVKKRFVEEPGQMKLLIVVDKLLTGFDAPPATYLYIDKQMRDHGLFQAICRVNRLDGEDKEYGYIIDYKDLFRSLEKSIQDYTGEAFDGYDEEDVAGLLKDRLKKGRERLEEVREAIKALCEPVEPPRDTLAYLRFFGAANSEDKAALKEAEPKRVMLYKLAAAYLRAYANLACEMLEAGYGEEEAAKIKAEVTHYDKVRDEVMRASGDYVDLKRYEPAMRHLLDTYIRAEESEVVSAFDDMTLVELIVARGEDGLQALPEGIRENKEAMAEAIENNVRRTIIDKMAVNPTYYEKMSELLDALIKERKKQAENYKKYLEKIIALARQVVRPESSASYPSSLNTGALRALYDNLGKDEKLAIEVDEAIRKIKKDAWRENRFKCKEVKQAIRKVLGSDHEQVDRIFELAVNQHEY